MSKKYLIDESDMDYLTKTYGMLPKTEVEVLDINAVIVESATEGIRLHDYLKANNLLIVKIKE